MEFEQDTLRRNVEAQIALTRAHGPWEGRYLDFKEKLEDNRPALAKALRSMLAFANTPRNRESYIIYGVVDQTGEHIGVTTFPKVEGIEHLIREYTDLQGIIIDANYTIGGKLTPYIVVPLQYKDGPYCLNREIKDSRRVVRTDVVYLRNGSCNAAAGERERRLMADWPSWFLDGRYVSTLHDLQDVIRRTFPNLKEIQDRSDHLRLVFDHTTSDSLGIATRCVLAHAYPGLRMLSNQDVQTLANDSLDTSHDRWFIAPRLHASALAECQRLGIRVVSIDDIFLAKDPYARYCDAYLKWWESERVKYLFGPVIDLDFTFHDQTTRQKSILSWLAAALNEKTRSPALLVGEFGTGKTITVRQLVADTCEAYRRRASDLKAIYVNLNALDIRAGRTEFVERALMDLDLSRDDVYELVKLVEQNRVSLVLDAVDEMARPYSQAGRLEALQLIRENTNELPCIVTVRANYFRDDQELHTWFQKLMPYGSGERSAEERLAQLCNLTDLQVEELLSAGLSDSDEAVDVKSVARNLRAAGLGTFLKDPLVLSLCLDLLRNKEEVELTGNFGKLRLISALLQKLIKREEDKRRRERARLETSQFYNLLSWVAYSMVKDDRAFFSIDQIEQFVRSRLAAGAATEDIAHEMAEEFRTKTWLHTEGGNYSFRHEVFSGVLAADYMLNALAPETIQELGDWNPNSINAETVAGYCRELLSPRQAITIASCIVRANVTVGAKRLVLDLLKDLDLSAKAELDPKWLGDRNASVDIGSAVAAAAIEPVIARAVLSVLLPLLSKSKKAQQAVLCYLGLVRSSSLGTAAVMNELQTVFAALSGLTNAGGGRMAFENLLGQGDSLNGTDDRLVKSAGLSLHNVKDPFTYHTQIVDFAGRLAKDRPDNRTYVYVRHAADYLSSYAKSKAKSLQRRGHGG